MRKALAAVVLFSQCAGAADEPASAPFFTTPEAVVHRMLQLADTQAGDLVVDLGSGDGRIVIAAAQKFGARGLGIELDPGLVGKSRQNAAQAGVADRVTFIQGDVLAADISRASVVTVYLLPGLINRLQPKFLDTLQPGTRIVSHAFTMTSWRPDRRETMQIEGRHPGQGDQSTLFLWVVPAEVRGLWEAAGGTSLRMYQNFQDVQLEGRLLGRDVSASRGALRGRELEWEANGLRFKGRVQDGLISGVLGGEPLVLRRAR